MVLFQPRGAFGGRRLSPVGWAFFLVLITAGSLRAGQREAELRVFDQCIESGKTVWLKARLVSGLGPFAQRPVSGERIRFLINGEPLVPTLTGGEGLAAVRLLPPEAGTYEITAELLPNPRYRSPAEKGLLVYGHQGKKIVVVSAGSTRRASAPGLIPWIEPASYDVMPEADSVMNRWSGLVQLVYLHEAAEGELKTFRDWLHAKHFPAAPILIQAPSPSEESRQERSLEILKGLKGVGPLSMGITRSPAEAAAFAQLGMRALLLSEDEDSGLPDGTEVFSNWQELSRMVDGGP